MRRQESIQKQQGSGLQKRMTNWLKTKRSEAKKQGRKDGKIYVDGLGWVELDSWAFAHFVLGRKPVG